MDEPIQGALYKSAQVTKQALDAGELALINQWSLRPLTEEEVFVFRVAACDNQIDRDYERFTETALAKMAQLYPGHPILLDHHWSASKQTARVYAASVEDAGNGVQRLVLRAYMLRTEDTKAMIDAIEGGILREVSVGIQVTVYRCSICGRDYFDVGCAHRRGKDYDGKTCSVELDGVADVYELSFVAVPAQPGAGVIKRYERKETQEPEHMGAEGPTQEELDRAKARMELENKRYGGNLT